VPEHGQTPPQETGRVPEKHQIRSVRHHLDHALHYRLFRGSGGRPVPLETVRIRSGKLLLSAFVSRHLAGPLRDDQTVLAGRLDHPAHRLCPAGLRPGVLEHDYDRRRASGIVRPAYTVGHCHDHVGRLVSQRAEQAAEPGPSAVRRTQRRRHGRRAGIRRPVLAVRVLRRQADDAGPAGHFRAAHFQPFPGGHDSGGTSVFPPPCTAAGRPPRFRAGTARRPGGGREPQKGQSGGGPLPGGCRAGCGSGGSRRDGAGPPDAGPKGENAAFLSAVPRQGGAGIDGYARGRRLGA